MLFIYELFLCWFLPVQYRLQRRFKNRGSVITDQEFEKVYNDIVRSMEVSREPTGDFVVTKVVDCPIEIDAGLFEMLEPDEMEYILEMNYDIMITYNKTGDPVGFVGFVECGKWIDIYSQFMYVDYCFYWAIKEQVSAVVNLAPEKRVRMYTPDQIPPEAHRAYYDCGLEAAASSKGAIRWVKPMRGLGE